MAKLKRKQPVECNLQITDNYEHISSKAFELLNFEKSSNQEKEAGCNFVSLFQWRNVAGQFKKPYLHTSIKIVHFLTRARIQKCLTQLQNILSFLTINHLQAEWRM